MLMLCAETRKKPGVPPSALLVKNIRLFAVTDVFDTVTVPATSVAVPIFALEPSLTLNPCPATVVAMLPSRLNLVCPIVGCCAKQ